MYGAAIMVRARAQFVAFREVSGLDRLKKEGRHEGRPSEDMGLRTPYPTVTTCEWRTPRRHARP